ncbi:MAG: SDR family oxidoreductase [Halioglobus sp.]
MNFEGITVLLTGATGGIGRSFAHALAQRGAHLVLVSRNGDPLGQLCAELSGDKHTIVSADIATSEGREQVLQACTDSVNVLINNAGANHFGVFEAHKEDQLRTMFDVNIIAPFLLTQAFLPKLESVGGTVINVGSGLGSIGFPGQSGYSASKFALRGFSQALRRELSDRNIRVAYLAPRATDTEMNVDAVVEMNKELGNQMDSPDTVAKALIDLLNGSSGTRFIGWPERFFIKLNSLYPSLIDSALGKQLPVIRRYAKAAELSTSVSSP